MTALTPEAVGAGLLPCPFCGAAQEVDPATENGVSFYASHKLRFWHVHCHGCGATTEGHEDSKERARERWNTRAQSRDAVIEECAAACEAHLVEGATFFAALVRSLKQPAGGE